MNLKLKRLVRTNSSEQYALFDLDQMDAAHQPITIGKLDMHYTNEGIYGTILLWDDVSRGMGIEQRKDLVQILLDEISTPMGVPNEYVFEFFAPTLDEYEVIHNVGLDLIEESSEDEAYPVDTEADYTLSADSAGHDTGVPDTTVMDSAVTDNAVTDNAVTDNAVTDSAVTDSAVMDTVVNDSGSENAFEREQFAAAKPFGDAPAN